MTMMKKFSRTIFFVLSLAGIALSASYVPFVFENVSEDSASQQNEWNYLMKYKIFGQTGIIFRGQNIKIPDQSGWFGTATGDFDVSGGNQNHLVGGPILIGGNMKWGDGHDTLSSGPVRVLGNVTVGNFNSPNVMLGDQCVQGTVDSKYRDVVGAGNQYFGENYANCPEEVPEVKQTLAIPVFPAEADTAVYAAAININNDSVYIDVPEGDDTYDYFVDAISMNNNSRLIVRMPNGGRLTRIFVKNGFALSAHPMIRIYYMDEDATYENGTWSGGYTAIENRGYSGNLLFYTENDIAWPAINATDSIQGTFISKGTISIQQHMTLAGQLLANKVEINADFDGSGFLYVPFDPPVLDIDPTALAAGVFPENDLDASIPIKLSDTARVTVMFNYCFEVKSEEETLYGYASIEDMNVTEKSPFPICGVDSGFVKIAMGDTVPRGSSEVYINVKKDGIEEPNETLLFRVYNLAGAVLPGNKREGSFKLTLANQGDVAPPLTKDMTVSTKEDVVLTFQDTDFYYADTSDSPKEQKGIVVKTLPTKGTLTYKDKKVTVNTHIPLDSIADLKFTAVADEYDATSYATFDFVVENVLGMVSDSATVTISVTPVNDAPVVQDAVFTINENNTDGVPLTGAFKVTDVDDSVFTYAFDTTDPNFAVVDSLFSLDQATGEMSVKPGIVLDYENMTTEYTIKVVVSDQSASTGDAADILSSTATATIKVLDVNESPVLEEQKFVVDEHLPQGTVVDTMVFDDLDTDASLRNDVFTAVGGDTAFFSVNEMGVITTKKEFDYETERRTYTIDVALTDASDPTLKVVKTMTIDILNVNENPVIVTEKVSVTENATSGTVVDTIKATDADLDDSVLTYKLVETSKYFEVSEEGVITVKKDAKIDYETVKTTLLVVKVTDSHGGSSRKTITVEIIDIPPSSIEITKAENSDTTWTNPDTLYTNLTDLTLYCSMNGGKEELCADTTLKEGKNVIVKTFNDPDLDGPASDTVVVFLSTEAPVVTVTANPDDLDAANIYTIVEPTDASDTNIYVNSTKNDVLVTVKDKASNTDTSFTVKLDLDTLSVSQKVYTSLTKVADEGVVLNENPSTTVTRTPVNGSEVQVSYTEKVSGTTVTVTYTTDNDGEVVKRAVVNEKGKVDSIEVITVSYVTTIDGEEVTVSYEADAVTGAVLYRDETGALTTSSTASGVYTVTYDYVDEAGNTVVVSYTVDKKGNLVKNAEGDIGYSVSYTYVNKYGNAATQSVFIVLDQVGPKVEILSPEDGSIIRANFVNVVWTVNGIEQDTLTLQGLEKGGNVIVRFYRDKAGNEASDTVFVVMKDNKDVQIAIEQPVTEITQEKVEEYYAENPPKEGETFAVSVRNPTTGEEVETLIGGDFETTEGSGEAPYPGKTDHLGPTLSLDIKLPVVNGVGGLATLDDLMGTDGLIALEGVDAENSEKMTVESYVEEYCEDDVTIGGDLSSLNLYNSQMNIQIWVYTSLGNFVDYFSFKQDMNDPSYTNEAGMLQMFVEMKPDKDGNVRAENGKLIGTGAYLYKVEATIKSHLRCTLPPVADPSGKKKGDVVKSSDDLLKPFGYKRPQK